MVETDLGFVFDEVLYFADISLGLGFLVLAGVDFLCPEFVDDGVECEEVDVLEVVVAPAGLLEFFGWFPGEDALEDAEFPEVFEGEL